MKNLLPLLLGLTLGCPEKSAHVSLRADAGMPPEASILSVGASNPLDLSSDAGQPASALERLKIIDEDNSRNQAFVAVSTDVPSTPILVYAGSIFSKAAQSFNRNLMALSITPGIDQIIIVLDSPGGDVTSAMTMVNTMRSNKTPTVCISTIGAMSAGLYVFELGCTKRVALVGSSFMIHWPEAQVVGSLTTRDLEKVLKDKRALDVAFLTPQAERMHMTFDELSKKIEDGPWFMTPEEAMKNGAVDCVAQKISTIQKDCPALFAKPSSPAKALQK